MHPVGGGHGWSGEQMETTVVDHQLKKRKKRAQMSLPEGVRRFLFSTPVTWK